MSYNTVADFRNYSITSGSFNSCPDGVIQEALDIAQDEVNAALRSHHTLPLTTVPAVIKEAERVIAGYRLWLTMGIDPGTNGGRLQQRYVEVYGDPATNPASGLLGQLAYGKRILVDSSDEEPSEKKGGPIVLGTYSRGWVTNDPNENKDSIP